MTYTEKRLEFESFDSFFAGLSMQDEKNAMKLYEKYIRSFFATSIHQAEQEMLKKVEKLAIGMLKHSDGSRCVECSTPSPFCKYDMAINDFIDHELPSLDKPLTDKEI